MGLFKITNAAITPGTQPHIHKINTIIIDPQPLSKTASGGQIIDKKTLNRLISNISCKDNYLLKLNHYTFLFQLKVYL